MIRGNFVLRCFFAVAACVYVPPIYTAQTSPMSHAGLDVQIPVAPMSVKIAGRTCLVYELHITNFRAVTVTLTRVDVLAGKGADVVLYSYEDAELASALARVGAPPEQFDNRVISGGQRVILFLWLELERSTPVPRVLQHRISFHSDERSGDASGDVQIGPSNVDKRTAIVLAPPLRGGPWAAVYDPSLNGGHRRALLAIGGKARIPARFAIDWIKLGPDGRAAKGDESVMSNYYGYGAEILAVADGSIVALEDGFPEPTPRSLKADAGNYIALDIGGGRFAFYEHLRPGSIRVKVGERVRIGQVLASLGGSGSISSGPHLHFHVGDASSPLAAEGLPFVFKSFEQLGAFESLQAFANGSPWLAKPAALRMEMPMMMTVVQFNDQR